MAGQVAESRARLIYEDGKVVLTDKREQDWSKITYNVLTEDELNEIFEKHPVALNEKLAKADFVFSTKGDYTFAEQRYAVLSMLITLHRDYYQCKHNPNDMLATYSYFAHVDKESLRLIYRRIQKEVFEVLDDFRSLDEKQYYQKYLSMFDKINIDIDNYSVGDDFTKLAEITNSYYIIAQYKQIERLNHANFHFDFENSNKEKIACSIVYHDNDYTNAIRYIKDRFIGVKLDFYDEAFSYIAFFECPHSDDTDKYARKVLFDILLYIYKKTHNRDTLMTMLEIAKRCCYREYKEMFVSEIDYDDDDDIPF